MVLARFISFNVILLGFLYFNDVTPSDNYQLFNARTEICCLGVIHTVNKTRNTRCCGTESYNSKTQICCKNVVHELKPGYKCCGNSTYNATESICCNGKVHQGSSDVYSCCGDQNIKRETQVCCGKSGVVAEKMEPDADVCCGNVAFVKGKAICCKKTICVVEGLILPTCCGERVWDRKDNKSRCCHGEFVFDVQKEICCVDRRKQPAEVKVIEKKLSKERCCGVELYDPKSSACCGNVVIEKPEKGKGICCKNVL